MSGSNGTSLILSIRENRTWCCVSCQRMSLVFCIAPLLRPGIAQDRGNRCRGQKELLRKDASARGDDFLWRPALRADSLQGLELPAGAIETAQGLLQVFAAMNRRHEAAHAGQHVLALFHQQ